MFLLKKLLSSLILPTTATLVLLGVGMTLLWWGRWQRAAKILVSCAFAVLLLGTSDFFVNATLRPLEDHYPPLYPRAQLDAAVASAGHTPRWIVVLGGGDTADPRVPANDQLSDSGLSRVVEGIRLLRLVPGTKLLLSGGVGKQEKHADALGAVATSLGVGADEMELDKTAWDTEQEAHNLSPRLGKEPFFLVTSAFHMPRAVALFRHAGAVPIPAPTHHLTLDVPGVSLSELFPSPDAMANLEAGWHEYLGLLWSKLRGRL
jgi:uncharacterized SAM-binding protein YcdF (DUF218 family)